MNVRFFAVFFGGVNFGFGLSYIFFVGKAVRGVEKERKVLMTRLLCETDHQASRFPKVILDLQPRYVHINENNSGRVGIPIFEGFDHFGVNAYTEDYMESGPKHEYGDRELIPGLWYYDDGYIDDPEYDKKIEALMRKAKEK